MITRVLRALKVLTPEDFRILAVIERGMIMHLFVPVELISAYAEIPMKKTLKILRRLNELGLVQRQKISYTGYILTSWGYDCLALNALYKSGILSSISVSPIGVGKESDVYIGLTPSNKKVTVKIHRSGRISFRQAKRKRLYLSDKRHISWLYRSRLSAKNEFTALKILHPFSFSVPIPVSWNRHIVVTEYYEGIELFRTPHLENPRETLKKIIEEVINIYKKGKIVHGDLSEYNIILLGKNTIEDKEFIIFDWPQWLHSSHPLAKEYFVRDLTNVLKFFKRKYIPTLEIEHEMKNVLDMISNKGE